MYEILMKLYNTLEHLSFSINNEQTLNRSIINSFNKNYIIVRNKKDESFFITHSVKNFIVKVSSIKETI